MMIEPVDTILDALSRNGPVRKVAGGHMARCPAHEDRNPSLSITAGADTRVLLKCHAGCTTEAIVTALGLTMRDLMPPRPDTERRIAATYDYHLPDGTLTRQSVRFDPKDFRQRRPDGNGGWVWNTKGTPDVLYHLPQIIAAIANGDTVWIVEGEKDADTLTAQGVTATTNPQGAGKWKPAYTEQLHGAEVVIVADADDPGRAHARAVADAIAATSDVQAIVEPAHGKDATDHIHAGGTLATFRPLTTNDLPKQEPNGHGPTHDIAGVTRIDVPALLATAPPEHAWIWDGYIERRTLTVIHGDGGTGKSILAGHLARAIIDGGTCLGRPTTPSNVLVVDAENPLDEIHRRLHRLDMRSVAVDRFAYYRAAEAILTPAGDAIDVDRLVALILREHAGVVILDSQRGLWAGDEREAVEIRVLYRRLQATAEEYDCAVIVIHHDRRTGSYSGSSDVNNAADTRLHLERPNPEKPERVLHHAKARSSAELAPVEYTFTVDASLAPHGGLFTFSLPREPVTDTTRVRDALTGDWSTSPEVAGRAHVQKNQAVLEALWTLTRDGFAEYAEGPEGRRKTAKCWRRRSHAAMSPRFPGQLGAVAAGDVDRTAPTGGHPAPLRGGVPSGAVGHDRTAPTETTPGQYGHNPHNEEPFE